MRFLVTLLMICFLSSPIQAEDTPDFKAFASWPVLHEGRVKTMESFARSVFYDVSGKTEIRGISAIEWLAISVFDPSTSIPMSFVTVGKNSILDLPETHDNLYSMAEVMVALNPYQDMILALEQRDPSTYTASQRDLMHVYQAVSLYNQIVQSFSAVLPLQGHDKPYIDGGGRKTQRDLILAGGIGNIMLKIVPTDNPSNPKISLWEAVNSGMETPLTDDIKSMAAAWNESDYTTWNALSRKVQNDLDNQTEYSFALKLESIYVTIQPMLWVIGFYLLAVGLYFVSKSLSILSLGAGFVMHLSALIARGFILHRPPTGTLYETLLFGSAVIMLVGLVVWFVNRNNRLFPILCGLSSAFLLFISRGFIQGDSLSVLVAVLNTNFWLSTHVTCIIIGYGFCIMAAVVAHMVLLSSQSQVKKLMLPLALAALLFTSVGTLLGGIWADQSWGRFWGWDPKENGALLIVLWLAWVLHGRISGHLKERGFAATLALTNVMVALTWFGVNLLGIGLHSYGFITSIAWGLGGFVILQVGVVVLLYLLPKMRGIKHA